MRFFPLFRFAIAVLAATSVAARAQLADSDELVSFDRDVRPILQKCIGCHGPDRPQAGLNLSDRAAAVESGAIVPHSVENSSLLERVASEDPDFRMPPDGGLDHQKQNLVRRWIAQGAPWPTHWAYRRLIKPNLPRLPADAPASWRLNPVDHFIAARLENAHLTPSPPADRPTLLRRIYYDLIGLPPTSDELTQFVQDSDAEAYERVVDRLLQSPHYGERWARHWMDVVHFAETHGHDQDRPRDDAWPYRDYLIRRLNQDLAYDRFVQEQIAGDVLFPDDPWAIVATGFLAAGPWDESSLRDIQEGGIDREIGQYLDRDDIVTTVMSTFVSTSVHCARCHHHKFDPISQDEYYGLQAVFAGIDKANRKYDPDPDVALRRRELQRQLAEADAWLVADDPRLLDDDVQSLATKWEADRREKEAVWQSLKRLDAASNADSRSGAALTIEDDGSLVANGNLPEKDPDSSELEPALPDDVARILGDDPAARTPADRRRLAAFAIQQQVRRELDALPEPALVYCGTNQFDPDGSFRSVGEPRPVRVLERGEISVPLRLARATTLSCIEGIEPDEALFAEASDAQRRTALAKWLSDSRNGLAWRSIANRVWHYHFGQPLVDTPNDFGHAGSAPTHPELLDWLAATLQECGGSLKKLHRLIVTSATYRQSSAHCDAAASVDAPNRLLWRMNRSRLDAEAFRDSLLAISGTLDKRMGGPSDRQFNQSKGVHVTPVVDYLNFDVDHPSNFRRSVYRFLFRTVPDPLMEALDCPDASLLTAKRSESVTAIQALATMNDKFVIRQSELLAERIAEEFSTPGDQVAAAYQRILGRLPASPERDLLAKYVERHGLANACRLLFNTNEFLFVD